MKHFLKLFLSTLVLFTLVISCDLITESEDDGDETEQLEFSVEPSEQLSQRVEETPSDFTWGFFRDNIKVNLIPGSDWSGEIVLTSFQVRKAEVVNENTSSSVQTNAEALSAGISTEELYSGSTWIPGMEWIPGMRWIPGMEWVPGDEWAPSDIEEIALSEVDLSENQTMVVVYAQVAENSSDREVSTQPYGLIFSEEASTGSLEVTTETAGQNPEDGYEVSVNETTENIGANETITIPELSVGEYETELTNIADNCEVVNGDNPRTVTIHADQTTSTTFEVTCAEALSGQLAFTSFRDGNANIYTISDDGSGVSQLTSHDEFDGQAAISPNGTKIAFTSERDGNREIYVMNSDGTGLTRLTNNSEEDEYPAWSPDGSRIVFSSQRDGVDKLFTMDNDGSNINRVNEFSNSLAINPDWSPDGERIVFVSLRDGEWEIYSITTEGNDETKLADNEGTGVDRAPEWSPDGSEIVFQSNRSGNNEIHRMDADGSNITQVTDNSSDDIKPTWSPSGNLIAFETNRAGGSDIFIIGRDSSNPERLTMNAAFDEAPDWSPVEE